MTRCDDLAAFAAVVREGSFTRAAAQMGVTQSALSQTIRARERRLDLKLLNRTTRSVSTTEAGERLYQPVGLRFADVDAELAVLSESRDTPAGTVRITASETAARMLVWPRLRGASCSTRQTWSLPRRWQGTGSPGCPRLSSMSLFQRGAWHRCRMIGPSPILAITCTTPVEVHPPLWHWSWRRCAHRRTSDGHAWPAVTGQA